MSHRHKPGKAEAKKSEKNFFYVLGLIALILMLLMYLMYRAT